MEKLLIFTIKLQLFQAGVISCLIEMIGDCELFASVLHLNFGLYMEMTLVTKNEPVVATERSLLLGINLKALCSLISFCGASWTDAFLLGHQSRKSHL